MKSLNAWVIPLKNNKGITVTNVLQKNQVSVVSNQIKYE